MIKIKRIEKTIITGKPDPIDECTFSTREDAYKFLHQHVPTITKEQIDEIMNYPETSFEVFGMINRGRVAYSGTIIYIIEISEV